MGIGRLGGDMAAEFGLLGEIEVRTAGRPIPIGGARKQAVLAVLLVEANRPVPAEQLVDRVWGARRLPERPSNALQTHLTLLRRALAPVEDVTITWRSTGYRLTVDEQLVDLHRFRGLLGKARAAADDDEHAAELFEQALRLWRGDPFGTLDTPWLADIRATLTRQRHAAQLDLADIQLRRGQHGTLVAELSDRAAEHPLDERLAGQIMLALYRCGRSADALEHYRRIRHRLAEDVGTDPGTALQQLHQRILTADPALALPTVHAPRRVGWPVVPRQLPAPPRSFTGRARELAQLTAMLSGQGTPGGPVVVSAIGGTGGIGKTWLALHWAHRHLDRFPDGQLYVNLRGFDPTGEPMSPEAALHGFLDALGVEPANMPRDQQARVGLYRSLIADRRMLVVLDNAADAAQVAPLLPGNQTCTVIVTSRRQLTGLVTAHGARSLTLDVLSEAESRQLLDRLVGHDRLTAEPDAAAELLAYCAALPLAISIVAARATSRPAFPLAVLTAELRDHTQRLDALDGGDLATNLRAVLSCSYHALRPEAATMFALLGRAPGPDIALSAAASLAALPTSRARIVLRELELAHLVHEHTPGRYRMHDLIRLYAADQANRAEPEAALRRLVDHYIHTAFAGDRLLHPHRPPIELDTPAAGCRPCPPPDQQAALAWFEAEHRCLLAIQRLAADRSWHHAVWQLTWTMDSFLARRAHLDWLAARRTGLAAAAHLGDPTARTIAHRVLGHACAQAGRHAEATDQLRQALTLAEHTGNLTEQAHTHQALARACLQQGQDRRALEHATHALRRYRALDNPVWEAEALNAVGWFSARLGHHTEANAQCEAALALFRRHHDRAGEAAALDSLGYVAHRRGRHTRALDHYQQALALRRHLGNAYQEADTLNRLGQTHAALGHRDQARDTWLQALRLFQEQGRTTDADLVQQRLDTLMDSSTDLHRQVD